MKELYVLTVICDNDIYNIIYEKMPSVNQIIDDVFDVHISELDPLDIDDISNMISKEVSEVETNNVYIEDFNTKLVFQRVRKIIEGKKYRNVIKYIKEGISIKDDYKKFIKDNFNQLCFIQDDDDSLTNFVACFNHEEGNRIQLHFNCDDYELEKSFLMDVGFKYLEITSAKVYEEDSDTLNIEEVIFEYK